MRDAKGLRKYAKALRDNSALLRRPGGSVAWIQDAKRQWSRTHKQVVELHERLDKLGPIAASTLELHCELGDPAGEEGGRIGIADLAREASGAAQPTDAARPSPRTLAVPIRTAWRSGH